MAGVDPAQTGKITQALSAQGIAYQLQNNGTAVAVQSSQEAQARVALAGQGLLAAGSGAGGSSPLSQLTSGSSLGQSQFQTHVAYQAALEQQLQSTIQSIQGVTSAQVQLALPDQTQQLFSGSTQQASAAVLLNDSGTITPASVKGIADLVANSVQGLTDQKVTITDQHGQLLWPSASGTTDGAALAKQSAEGSYDSQMAAQINGMLAQTLGPGKATVQVNADLNTNQTTLDSLTYTGKPIPITQQTTNESLRGGGSGSGGVAGTNTGGNIPSYAASGGSNSRYSNKSTNVTNGVDKTVTHTQVAPGQVNRQSVAVLVSSAVPASELPAIKAAVNAAAGINAKRGDTVTVQQIPFAKPAATASPTSPTKMLGYAKYGLVGLGALIFLFFVGRQLRKRENESFAGTPTWLRELESPRSLADVEAERAQLDQPTRVMQLRSPVSVAKQQVEDLVERDPDRVASQVRAWMSED
jgi:flagellar M-ring protein FliF